MFGAVFTLIILPWLDRPRYRPIFSKLFWVMVFNLGGLRWIGSRLPEGLYLWIGRIATIYYFVHFWIMCPLLSRFERVKKNTRRYVLKRCFLILLLVITSSILVAGHVVSFYKQEWSFLSPIGTFDRAALQRGFQVYKQVCSACHGIKYVSFRHMKALGLSEAEIKELASQYQIKDGPNDEGEMFDWPGRPSDYFPVMTGLFWATMRRIWKDIKWRYYNTTCNLSLFSADCMFFVATIFKVRYKSSKIY